MFIKQISVFLQNIRGSLFKLTDDLGDGKVNLKAISVADTANFGIVRLIVDQNEIESTAALLREKGYAIHINHVICVSVPDEPGGLSRILHMLDDGGISVEYLYSFVRTSGRDAQIILRLSDRHAGAELFKANGIRMLSPAELPV